MGHYVGLPSEYVNAFALLLYFITFQFVNTMVKSLCFIYLFITDISKVGGDLEM